MAVQETGQAETTELQPDAIGPAQDTVIGMANAARRYRSG
jgi:hypothetical protein